MEIKLCNLLPVWPNLVLNLTVGFKIAVQINMNFLNHGIPVKLRILPNNLTVALILLAILINVPSLASSQASNKCSDIFKYSVFSVVDETLILNLRDEFVGEETGVWVSTATGLFGGNQRLRKIFVKTRYLSDVEVQETVATVSSGKLISNFPQARDFIFVVTINGELRVFLKNIGESSVVRVKHSSLAQGQPAVIAGEIMLNLDGSIFSVNNRSGHYMPPPQNLKWFLTKLEEKGAQNVKEVDVSNRF